MNMPLGGMLGYDSAPMSIAPKDSLTALRAATDAELAVLARSGRDDAFEELVRRYRNEVYALSYHFVRQRDTAWDMSQEVFIKAYRSLQWFRGEASFKTWLMRITANQCKDYLKKRRLSTLPLDEGVGTEASSPALAPNRALEAKELGVAIEKALAGLPPKHQLAFVLREYEGLAYEEMAKVMQCGVGTVMSRLHHARKKLQHALRNMGVMEG